MDAMMPARFRRVWPCLFLALAPALPAAGLPAQTAGSSAHDVWAWAGPLLGLLIGAALGLAWGVRHRRARNALARQLQATSTEASLQDERLQAARSERDRMAERLQQQAVAFGRQAHEDGLTGLPNSRAFEEGFAHHFARSKRYGQALCLLLLDVDHFQQINDNWSRAVGDAVLKEAARLLRGVCRTSDLPARLDGDEFAVLLTDTDLEGGKRFSQRLHVAFAGYRGWRQADEAGPNYVTFSAGLVQLGDEDQAPAQLRQRAERALYLARHAGGNHTSLG